MKKKIVDYSSRYAVCFVIKFNTTLFTNDIYTHKQQTETKQTIKPFAHSLVDLQKTIIYIYILYSTCIAIANYISKRFNIRNRFVRVSSLKLTNYSIPANTWVKNYCSLENISCDKLTWKISPNLQTMGCIGSKNCWTIRYDAWNWLKQVEIVWCWDLDPYNIKLTFFSEVLFYFSNQLKTNNTNNYI